MQDNVFFFLLTAWIYAIASLHEDIWWNERFALKERYSFIYINQGNYEGLPEFKCVVMNHKTKPMVGAAIFVVYIRSERFEVGTGPIQKG